MPEPHKNSFIGVFQTVLIDKLFVHHRTYLACPPCAREGTLHEPTDATVGINTEI